MDHNEHERKLSDYIDQLNAEQRPEEHQNSSDSPELNELYQTVRQVRSLKEPAMPSKDYRRKLTRSLAGSSVSGKKPSAKRRNRIWLVSAASIALIFFISMLANYISPFGDSNIVHAMEDAYQEVAAYHGIVEVIQTSGNGESMTQAKLEVWINKDGHYYVKGLEGSQKDVITVNNGQQKWQIRPDQQQVHLFPAFPDTYLFTFELGNEIDAVTSALSTKVIKDDVVVGREASILEVSPEGGEAYQIWIDKKTKLPLQKQYAMHNAIQYTITYTEIEFTDSVPEELIAYQVPGDFEEINTNPEQIVTDLSEAQNIVGFIPAEMESIPDGYVQERIAVVSSKNLVKIYYTLPDQNTQVIVIQGKSTTELEPVQNASLGKINGQTAEIQSPIFEDTGILGGGGIYAGATDMSSIRYQQDGFEYAIVGNASLEQLGSFAEALAQGAFEMPEIDENNSNDPQVDVPVDLEIEEAEQKSADGGSSPWKLDPAYAAQVFVSLQMSPDGITGDYPIAYEDIEIVQNTGKDAIVKINGDQAPIEKVYLQRLVREDSTGIWTVVGYDPMN